MSPYVSPSRYGTRAPGSEPDFQPVTKLFAELRIRPGILAKRMVEMGGHHGHSRLPSGAKERIEKGHGVGTSGERRDNRNPGPEEAHEIEALPDG